MFNLSKSPSEDLQDKKTDIQHKVLCDWMRNIHNQNIQIARKLTNIYNLMNDQSSSPSGESMEEYDPSSSTQSV